MKVQWTNEASSQFDDIVEFLVVHAGEEFALKVALEILDAEDLIAQYPLAGQLELWLTDEGKGHRRVVVGNYKLIYRLERELIWITDVFETHQDPDQMKR